MSVLLNLASVMTTSLFRTQIIHINGEAWGEESNTFIIKKVFLRKYDSKDLSKARNYQEKYHFWGYEVADEELSY